MERFRSSLRREEQSRKLHDVCCSLRNRKATSWFTCSSFTSSIIQCTQHCNCFVFCQRAIDFDLKVEYAMSKREVQELIDDPETNIPCVRERRALSRQERGASPPSPPSLSVVNQGSTGEEPASAAKAQGITLPVVERTSARRGFVLLPRCWVVGRMIALDVWLPSLGQGRRAQGDHPGRVALRRLCLPALAPSLTTACGIGS